eukprot:6611386-Heterocapsa_arctica.AAC.1
MFAKRGIKVLIRSSITRAAQVNGLTLRKKNGRCSAVNPTTTRITSSIKPFGKDHIVRRVRHPKPCQETASNASLENRILIELVLSARFPVVARRSLNIVTKGTNHNLCVGGRVAQLPFKVRSVVLNQAITARVWGKPINPLGKVFTGMPTRAVLVGSLGLFGVRKCVPLHAPPQNLLNPKLTRSLTLVRPTGPCKIAAAILREVLSRLAWADGSPGDSLITAAGA